MNPRLIPDAGGATIELTEDILLIGRGDECDLPVEHKSVSKNHCVLARFPGHLTVRDLGSTNGTWVNGKRIARTATLLANDLLNIAAVRFRVEFESATCDATELSESRRSGPLTKDAHLVALDQVDLHIDDWQPGMEVFTGCVLVAKIGEGGFGKVWRAHRTGFGDIALKWIRITDPIRNEGRALRSIQGLRHRYLTRVFGCRRKGDILVVALEMGEENLEQRYQRYRAEGKPGIPQDELLTYTRQVGEALDYLYFTRKLLHRDVKPSNILLVKGVAKLCDMGLTKVLENEVGIHSGVASFDYAPPEFFEGKMVASSDQFSLASTYCVLLTGQNPFPGPDIRRIMLQHVMGTPQLEALPLDQQPVLKRALTRNPDDRFESCSHFVLALRRAVGEKHK